MKQEPQQSEGYIGLQKQVDTSHCPIHKKLLDNLGRCKIEGCNVGWVDCPSDTQIIPGLATSDPVNHPQHYGGEDNPYETIKVIEAWGLGFCLGNAVKYISRAGKKGDALEDLKKARWYLDHAIQEIEKGGPLVMLRRSI